MTDGYSAYSNMPEEVNFKTNFIYLSNETAIINMNIYFLFRLFSYKQYETEQLNLEF